MKIITAPQNFENIPKDRHELFLAGSIEMGRALDWQSEIIVQLEGYLNQNKLRIYNPRRAIWDTTWSQDHTHPELREQIQWELRALKRADTIVFYFDPATLSPITLLEFGKYAASGKSIVYCPLGFWRRANVLITAEEDDTIVVESVEVLVEKIRSRIVNA